MPPEASFILVLAVALPLLWLLSEFSSSRPLRISLGVLALVMSFGVAFVVAMLERLNDNAWYGAASKRLIDATVAQIESGNIKRLLPELKRLQAEFHPTYENRARYDRLIDEFVERLDEDPRAPAVQPQGGHENDGPATILQ